MDRSRLLLALTLSALILFAWPLVMGYLYPPPPRPPITEVPIEPRPAPQRVEPAPPQTVDLEAEVLTRAEPREFTIETGYWRVRLSNEGAVVSSWILKKQKSGEHARELVAADRGQLELVSQDPAVVSKLGRPLALHMPGSPELASRLNRAVYEVEGVSEDEDLIRLEGNESREITFSHTIGGTRASKIFRFFGDQFVFDATVAVATGETIHPSYLVIGPRFGDQSAKPTGSAYNTPPQAITYDRTGESSRRLASSVSQKAASVSRIEQDPPRIELDNPLQSGSDWVHVLSASDQSFMGQARVIAREADGRLLTLDSIPEGTTVNSGVAPAFEALSGSFLWTGLVDHYFGMVAIPTRPIERVEVANAQFFDPETRTLVDHPSMAIPVYRDSPTRFFVGAKDLDLLEEVGALTGVELRPLIDYGWFAFMIRPIIPLINWSLNGLNAIFNNYGWSIVLLTTVINLALSPLRWYSSKKMKKAAKHQPRMKELQDRMKKLRELQKGKEAQKRYEREMQELQREQIALMKEANPLGGCLPLLLQMPIFWAFFVFLTISLDVRHAPWMFWIRDLSAADPYYALPIVMCVSMIAATKLTPMPASADPAMKMQRIMMTWLMPILLTWLFFFSAPSGLVLYWMVSNLVGVVIQLVINKATAEAEQPVTTDVKGSQRSQKSGQRNRRKAEKEIVGSIK